MGSAVSSGVVVPMLLIGGAWGRLCGLLLNEMFGVHQEPGLQWLDPGAFALIGAAAFFGGVSRLTMSLTVIMMEITNDIHFLLPIMVAIMVAKLVADSSTHSLYHALIELKCIPFLDHQPSAPGGVVKSILHQRSNKTHLRERFLNLLWCVLCRHYKRTRHGDFSRAHSRLQILHALPNVPPYHGQHPARRHPGRLPGQRSQHNTVSSGAGSHESGRRNPQTTGGTL